MSCVVLFSGRQGKIWQTSNFGQNIFSVLFFDFRKCARKGARETRGPINGIIFGGNIYKVIYSGLKVKLVSLNKKKETNK